MTKDERQFEQLLAAHCAPVLKNRKTANMFHIERDRFHDLAALLRTYQQKLSQKGIDFALFQAECPRVTVFVYQQRRLSLLLQRSDIQAFLSDYGYPSGALSAILQHLDHRLSLCESYPHEIGIFLGFPLYDVIGFIEQRRCLLQGYWNVYRYPQAARRLFALYDRCIRELQADCMAVPASNSSSEHIKTNDPLMRSLVFFISYVVRHRSAYPSFLPPTMKCPVLHRSALPAPEANIDIDDKKGSDAPSPAERHHNSRSASVLGSPAVSDETKRKTVLTALCFAAPVS